MAPRELLALWWLTEAQLADPRPRASSWSRAAGVIAASRLVVLAPPRRCRATADVVQESAWSVSSMVNAVVMVVSSCGCLWWMATEDAGKAMARALSVVGAQRRRAGRAPPARHRQETGEGADVVVRRLVGPSCAEQSVVDDGFTNGDCARFKTTWPRFQETSC
ncbi:hypothetical protein Dimus_037010, partial [Dionaea muscipula]